MDEASGVAESMRLSAIYFYLGCACRHGGEASPFGITAMSLSNELASIQRDDTSGSCCANADMFALPTERANGQRCGLVEWLAAMGERQTSSVIMLPPYLHSHHKLLQGG